MSRLDFYYKLILPLGVLTINIHKTAVVKALFDPDLLGEFAESSKAVLY
ncbi:MAG: hypothetical protein U9M89_02665 [Patescibacteria group bacterium]|nr:hypothetical protein [Patescibacteria group bacterium]